jgi:hypothetical protein
MRIIINCNCKDFLVEWQLKKPGWPYDQIQPLRVVVVIIVVDVAIATLDEEVI